MSFPDSSQIICFEWISLDEYSGAPMPLEHWRVQSLPQRRSVDVYAHRAVVATAAHQMAMAQNGPKQKQENMKQTWWISVYDLDVCKS